MRKKLITMGLVSALGASTPVMAIDLDPAAKDKADILAQDTVVAAQVVAGTAFNDINVGAHQLVDTTSIGVGIAADDQNFLRVELGNAVFADAATGTVANAVVSIIDGGTAKDDYVIFGVQAGNTGIDQTAVFDLTNSNFGVTPGTDVTVTISHYATQPGAINETASDLLYSISGTGYTWADSVALNATTTKANNEIAEVSQDFKQFVEGTGTDLIANVGDIQIRASNAINVQTGATANIADGVSLATSKINFTGDFSTGDWDFGANGNCAAATPLTANAPTVATDKLSASVTNITGLDGNAVTLCNTVDGTTDVINASGYAFEIDLAPAATTQVAPSDLSGTMGTISRNGTTVQIPYLTTFEDYNQRLVIVNRGAADAAYNITFTSEDGVTATAGDAASGTVPAGEVLSLKATDIVTLAGRTRTAATLTVVAPAANVDVATNQVNLGDSSTDTVVLQ